MIPFKDSLSVAHAVLNIINVILAEDECTGLWVESFSNGREQGLCIKTYMTHVSFSENRGSDQIVVYSGKNFSMQGNCPDWEGKYETSYFAYDQHYAAAAHIAHLLREAALEWEEIKRKQNENTATKVRAGRS